MKGKVRGGGGEMFGFLRMVTCSGGHTFDSKNVKNNRNGGFVNGQV